MVCILSIKLMKLKTIPVYEMYAYVVPVISYNIVILSHFESVTHITQ